MATPTTAQRKRIELAVIQKAVRLLILPETPFGSFGEMTEYGVRAVRPDFAIKELLAGMVGKGLAVRGLQHTVSVDVGDSDGGTFTLTYGANTTAAIDYDATNYEVETALMALASVTLVIVTGSGTEDDPWVLNFGTNDDTTAVTGDDTLLENGELTIEVTQQGIDPVVTVAAADVIRIGFDDPSVFTADRTADVDIAIEAAWDWVEDYLEGFGIY